VARGKTRRDRAAVLADIAQITRARWANRVLNTTLTGQGPDSKAAPRLAARPRRPPGALETELFGKRLFVTDHDEWTVTDVVAGYRSQNDVESGFRQLKDSPPRRVPRR